MKYETYTPGAELARYIRCYWLLESDTAENNRERDRVFPDGCIELIFHHGDLFKKYRNARVADIQPRSFIHGQLKKYMELEPTGRVGVFSARFNPGGLQPFVDFPVSRITGKIISIENAWPGKGSALEQKMLSASSPAEKTAVLEAFLIDRLREGKKESGIVEHCVNQIIQKNGNIQLDSLMEATGVGKRYLERNFNLAVGLSPKLFCRIIRFNHTLQLIDKKDFTSFTSVAHEGGFYDQAHFIRDFKDFTGLNPRHYFMENLEMVKFFNL